MDIRFWVILITNIFFIFTGTLYATGMIKRNKFFGLINPWTVANDVVWNKIHRIWGIVIALTSIMAIAGLFLLPNTPFKWSYFILEIAVFTTAYWIHSYLIYRSIRQQSFTSKIKNFYKKL